MHWKASIDTVRAITHMYEGWSAYPSAEDMGLRNSSTRATKRAEVVPTMRSMVE